MTFHIVEVVEVIGAEKAKEYTDAGWIVLGTIAHKTPEEEYFIYSLGRLETVP